MPCKARNPLGVKTLMNVLGMPSGPCRRPLGKMTKAGIQVVIDAAKKVQSADPGALAPVAEAFDVDIDGRLADTSLVDRLTYASY